MTSDLGTQLKGISNFLKRNSEERRAVPPAEDILAMADQLDTIARTLGKKRWGLLKSNRRQYAATLKGLRAIAGTAREQARFLPDRRIKDHYDWATETFLQVWLDAGKGWPKLYEKSEAVVALGGVLADAGIPRSPGLIIGLLRRAMENPRVPKGVDFDFVSIACAYAKATGIGGDAMLSSIFEQAGRLTEEVIESDPVAAAVRDFVAAQRTWTETAAELLAVLTDPNRKPPEGWPKSLESMIQRLRKSLESDVG